MFLAIVEWQFSTRKCNPKFRFYHYNQEFYLSRQAGANPCEAMAPLTKRLDELCLNSVVRSFRRFISFLDTEYGRRNSHLYLLLQKKYSDVIFKKLNSPVEFRMEEDDLRFLINSYLTKLHLTKKNFTFRNVIIERLSAVGENLVHLTLKKIQTQDITILKIVKLIPNVEELNLSYTASTDEILHYIDRSCPKLRILNMSSTNITQCGIRSLCSGNRQPNETLTELYIAHNDIKANALLLLLQKKYKNMKLLDHINTVKALGIYYDAIKNDNKLTPMPKFNLTYLHAKLSGGPLPFVTFGEVVYLNQEMHLLSACARLCPDVSTLKVSSLIDDSVISSCGEFKQLKSVSISATNLGNYTLLCELLGHYLTSLELNSGILSLEALSRCCPNLESLKLGLLMKDSNDLVAAECEMPKLSILYLDNFGFDEIDNYDELTINRLLNCCINLKVLVCVKCKITSQLFASATTSNCMKTLENLKFAFCNIPVYLAKTFLLAAPKLDKLVIKYNDDSREKYSDILGFKYERMIRTEIVLNRIRFENQRESNSESSSEPDDFN